MCVKNEPATVPCLNDDQMNQTDYPIKNCTAAHVAHACPGRWSGLTPSLAAAMRHCDHCHRKVYLCTTDADIKLYTSVNYCIAVPKAKMGVEKGLDASLPPVLSLVSSVGSSSQGVSLTSAMLPVSQERKTTLTLVANGMYSDAHAESLRATVPDRHVAQGGEQPH